MKTYTEFLNEGVDPEVKKLKKGQTIKYYVKSGTSHLFTGTIVKVGSNYFIIKMLPTGDTTYILKSDLEIDK